MSVVASERISSRSRTLPSPAHPPKLTDGDSSRASLSLHESLSTSDRSLSDSFTLARPSSSSDASRGARADFCPDSSPFVPGDPPCATLDRR
ncbi:MAG: hypothetical protein DMF65_10705 [Acidobacteria bacterium]|nr:MAG: hypothetical protein DMF65_10705 [Acidobacteriota bacterium]